MPWIDVKQLARELGVKPDFVYRHAGELGGRQFGRMWRFDLIEAQAAFQKREPQAPPPPPRNRRGGRTPSGVPLLPVKR